MIFRKKDFLLGLKSEDAFLSSENEKIQTHQRIREEQLDSAYRHIPLSLWVVIINSIVLVAIEWKVIDHRILLGWLGLQFFVVIARYYIYRSYLNPDRYRSTQGWENCYIAGVIVSALVWGITAGVFFLTDDIVHQSFLTFVLAGMSAGAAITLSSILRAIYSYLAILIIPVVVALFLQHTEVHNAMAILIVLFGIMLMVASRRTNQNIYNMFKSQIQYENTSKMLDLSEEHFQIIFKDAPAGILYYDSNLIVIDSNIEMMEILHITKENMIGLDLKKLPDKCLDEAINAPFGGHKGYYEGPYTTMIKKLDLWITLRTSPMYDAQRNIIGGVAIVTDITDRINAEEKIKHQAYFDALTDIPNRILLKDRIEQSLAQYRRHGTLIAIMFLDLDHFKSINDSLGHHVGDLLLIETASRLISICREGDTVARLGGDEFVILLNELGSDTHIAATRAETVAEKIHKVLSLPFDVGQSEAITTSSSIGITIVSSNEQNADDLLKFADTAMYQAKKEGRNTTRFYQEKMDQWIKKRLFLENGLRHAIKNGELELYYQPVIEIDTKKIIGAEALLRWNHPEIGLVMPDEMITIAEESGLIVPIGEWVMREACKQFIEWKTHHPKGGDIERIAINVSAIQFRQNDFVDKVISIVTETRISPSMVEIELTESMIIDKVDTVIEKMKRLRAFGINLSMDDFGTGYSSLAYLKRLPFTTLKIDRSFVRDIMSDSDDAALVETILSMATIFNLDVIAEGVETVEQFEFLEHHQCRYFQGYLCSKPVQVQRFAELLSYDIQNCHRSV